MTNSSLVGMQEYDVIVIGAGAAGLLAAGRAAQMGAKTLLLEKMQKPARKLFITGKGRCNITTATPKDEFIRKMPVNGNFLKNSFSQFFSTDILQLMEKYNVPTKLERGERYFPKSDRAKDVIDVLLKWISSEGVQLVCNQQVSNIIVENNQVKGVQLYDKQIFATKVIVATGGKSYSATGSTGDGYKIAKQVAHNIINPRPALVPLETDSTLPKQWKKLILKNINVTLWIDNKKCDEDFGELMFTKFGLSGATVLNLSRLAVEALQQGKQVKISIDLKPALNEQKLDARLQRELNTLGKKDIVELLKTLMPQIMIPAFVKKIGIDKNKLCNQITGKERKKILFMLKNLTFNITNHRSFDEAIITAGGIDTKEITPKTMESKKVKNLYFVGEVLNLDAPTGGYNLQIAFTTGWVAGNDCEATIIN